MNLCASHAVESGRGLWTCIVHSNRKSYTTVMAFAGSRFSAKVMKSVMNIESLPNTDQKRVCALVQWLTLRDTVWCITQSTPNPETAISHVFCKTAAHALFFLSTVSLIYPGRSVERSARRISTRLISGGSCEYRMSFCANALLDSRVSEFSFRAAM